MDSEETPLFHDIENLYILYAVCHIASMTSAISNPLLYGFMNENFRKEFSNIWTSLKRCSSCKSASSNGIATSEEIPINPINHLTKPVDVWIWKYIYLFLFYWSFDSLLVLDDCLMTTLWLPEDCLMTAWWLPDDCLIIVWRLSDDHLKDFVPTWNLKLDKIPNKTKTNFWLYNNEVASETSQPKSIAFV